METQGKSAAVLSSTFSTVFPLASGNSTSRECRVLRCFGARWDFRVVFFADCFIKERPLFALVFNGGNQNRASLEPWTTKSLFYSL
jgi:DNA-binding XRE family transcriptional regulator